MTNRRDFTDAELVARARDVLAGVSKEEQILLYLGSHVGPVPLDDLIVPFSDGTLDGAEEVIGTLKQMAAEGRIHIHGGRVTLQ